jgi:hypothetical protein
MGSAITVLGTPIFPYATSFYGHVMAGGFLMAGLACLDATSDGGQQAENDARRGFSLRCAAGACLATSVGCEYLSAVPAGALFVAFALLAFWPRTRTSGAEYRGAPWREFVWPLLLGGIGPVLLIAGYQWLCFGAPWRTGYSFVVDPTFAAGHATGFLGVRTPHLAALWGLCFGRLRGLFYIAPVALPLAVGLVARARAGDRTALAAALGFTSLLLVNASYYMWWGGAAAGPRHLVPVLGCLALGVPWLCERRWLRRLSAVLGAISVANMLAIAAIGLEAPEHGDVLVDFVYKRLLLGKLSELSGASNLGVEVGLARGGTLGPLLVWLLIGWYMLEQQVHEVAAEPALAR